MEQKQEQEQEKKETNGWKILAIVILAAAVINVLYRFFKFANTAGAAYDELLGAVITLASVSLSCGIVILLTQILDELKRLNK